MCSSSTLEALDSQQSQTTVLFSPLAPATLKLRRLLSVSIVAVSLRSVWETRTSKKVPVFGNGDIFPVFQPSDRGVKLSNSRMSPPLCSHRRPRLLLQRLWPPAVLWFIGERLQRFFPGWQWQMCCFSRRRECRRLRRPFSPGLCGEKITRGGKQTCVLGLRAK